MESSPSPTTSSADSSTVRSDHADSIQYAGFWKRAGAMFIDGIVLVVGSGIIGGILGVLYALSTGMAEGAEFMGQVVGTMISWIYYAGFESSTNQATPGKMALGLQVTNMEGRRIGFGKATGRHFGKIISTFILLIGYIMAGFTEKKQALHDKMAGCLVVVDEDASNS